MANLAEASSERGTGPTFIVRVMFLCCRLAPHGSRLLCRAGGCLMRTWAGLLHVPYRVLSLRSVVGVYPRYADFSSSWQWSVVKIWYWATHQISSSASLLCCHCTDDKWNLTRHTNSFNSEFMLWQRDNGCALRCKLIQDKLSISCT